ncbi:hypothetical protein P3S68_026853 [Capsicum galapagoense]
MTQKNKSEEKLANNTEKQVAIPELKAKLSKLIISDGEDASQNFNNTNQMDVDRVACHHFQEEILMEILSRLPVRSLLRFKCISSVWKTLISEPYFKMKHLNWAKNDQGSQKLLITQPCPNDNNIASMYCCPLSPVQLIEDIQKLKLDCPSNPKPWHCKIHCCCDGLAVIEVPDILDYNRVTLLLWNPTTRESIVLPALESTHDAESRFGLGYDSTSGDYKILHIYQDDRDYKLPHEILALKSGSWRRIDKHPRGFSNLMFAMQFLAFVHAAFHWIGTSRNCFAVVSFSISNEVYGEIPLPEEITRVKIKNCIGISVLEGMLCVYLNSYIWRNDTYKLWVLKEYGAKGSWMTLLTIQDRSIFKIVPKYRFADGELLFCCSTEEFLAQREFRTTSGPFVSWPEHDVANGYAFTKSLMSPTSLTN